MTDKATSDLWWKNAVIYCADVATWQDSDGDGTGDLAGLTRRLDYLWGLGINTLWMMPFYPSPLGDDGYDITDYYAVDPRFGTLGDFTRDDPHGGQPGHPGAGRPGNEPYQQPASLVPAVPPRPQLAVPGLLPLERYEAGRTQRGGVPR